MGHMILANYMVSHTDISEIWFVVSPQNPLKKKGTLLDEIHRYAIVERAIEEDERFKVSNIEFSMPKPSYTIDTVVRLEEKHPDNEFVLIVGEDNLSSFSKWKNADELLNRCELYVYPRNNEQRSSAYRDHPKVKLVPAPQIELSATFIRKSIQEGKDIHWLLPAKAWTYIDEMNFYKG